MVNDITHLMAQNSLECPFQFCQNLDNQTTATLEKLDEAPEDKLTIFCKVLKLSETKVVGKAKYNVANATIAASSFPGSFLYFEKEPWLGLVTCLSMPTQATQRVDPQLNFVNIL